MVGVADQAARAVAAGGQQLLELPGDLPVPSGDTTSTPRSLGASLPWVRVRRARSSDVAEMALVLAEVAGAQELYLR